MNKNNLPNNLYELRRAANLSQEEFAEKLGVSRQAVSKWERGEAYPDTENLIVISEMFGVSIDELLRADNIKAKPSGNANTNEAERDTDKESDDGYFRVNVNDTVKVNLNGGITVDDDDKTVRINLGNSDITVNDEDGVKVKLGKHGITVNDEDGVKVKLGKHGITINDDDDDDDDDDDNDDPELYRSTKFAILYDIPYPIIATIAFLVLGLFFEAWNWAWTLFMTIPIYYSTLSAIRRKKFSNFAYPVFAAFLYCLFGMLFHWWHPGWVIFITIPVYYSIAEAIDKHIRNKGR